MLEDLVNGKEVELRLDLGLVLRTSHPRSSASEVWEEGEEEERRRDLEGAERTACLEGEGEPVKARRGGAREREDVGALSSVDAGPGVVGVDVGR